MHLYKGNGVAREFPVPKGAKGNAIVYALGGREVILKKGEGFDVVDGNVVFVKPPPEGSVIYVGTEASGEAITSTDALTRITDGIAQLSAMMESGRLHVANAEKMNVAAVKQLTDMHDDYVKRLNTIVIEAGDGVRKAFDVRLQEAGRALRAEVADALQEMRLLAESAKDYESSAGKHYKAAANAVIEAEACVEACKNANKEGLAAVMEERDRTRAIHDESAAVIERRHLEVLDDIKAAIDEGLKRAESIRDELNRSLAVAADRAERTTQAVEAVRAGAGNILTRR